MYVVGFEHVQLGGSPEVDFKSSFSSVEQRFSSCSHPGLVGMV